MKPVTLLLAWNLDDAVMGHPLSTLKATPVATNSGESQSVATDQQQKTTKRKRLSVNVKRVYQLDLGDQPVDLHSQVAEIQPGRSIWSKTVPTN